jgi:hypothetical protein
MWCTPTRPQTPIYLKNEISRDIKPCRLVMTDFSDKYNASNSGYISLRTESPLWNGITILLRNIGKYLPVHTDNIPKDLILHKSCHENIESRTCRLYLRTATLTETSGNIHSSTWSDPESRRTLFSAVLRHFSIYILQFSSYNYVHSGSEHFSSFVLLAMKKPISNVSVSEMFNLGSRS